MELIKAEVSANYGSRKIDGHSMQILSDEDTKLWFNISLGEKEDDYATVSFKLDELLAAIGKAVTSPEDLS